MSDIIKKKKVNQDELKGLGIDISGWSKWDCEPSEFPWQYDGTETAYVFEGHVEVTPEGGQPVIVEAGDLIQFPDGMKCHWKVNQAIRKVYTFTQVNF